MNAIFRSVIILFTCICGLCTSAATIDNIVVPFGLRLSDGNSDNLAPFSVGRDSVFYQQVYAASEFARYEPLGGTITEILFRTDTQSGTYFNTTLPDIEIKMSTSSRAPDGLSSTLSENVGPDETVVVERGPLHLTGGSGAAVSFTIQIPLSHPFFYNPQAGNLLMEVRNLGGGDTTFFDAVNVLGDSVSRVYTLSSRGATPVVDTIGLVTDFYVTPIPEPATVWILGAGLTWLGWVLSRRKQGIATPRGNNPPS